MSNSFDAASGEIKAEDMVNLASNDCEEIKISIERSLKKRREVVTLLTTLEEAWRTAVDPYLALNKVEPENDAQHLEILSPDNKEILRVAKLKKQKTREIQQKIFLSFQMLTDNKHEEQITLGEEILRALPGTCLDEMISITEKTEIYFRTESSINKEFLENIKATCSKTEGFLKELKSIKEITCRDQRIENLFSQDIKLLEDFLIATKSLLG